MVGRFAAADKADTRQRRVVGWFVAADKAAADKAAADQAAADKIDADKATADKAAADKAAADKAAADKIAPRRRRSCSRAAKPLATAVVTTDSAVAT